MAEDVTGWDEEELTIEEILSPLSTQILLEYYNSGLFADTTPNSEVDSCPNCNLNNNPNLLPIHICSNNSSTSCNNISTTSNGNLSVMFDAQDEIDNVSASIDFSTSSPIFYISPRFEIAEQGQYQNVVSELPPYPNSALTRNLLGIPLPLTIEDCISSGITADPIIVPSGNMKLTYCVDTLGIFSGSALVSSEVMQPQVLHCLGDKGGFCYPDSEPNPGDVQALSSECQKLLNGHASTTPAKPSPPEMSAIDNRNFKVRKLSSEERKEKIHRYLKKRNERNFSKKIKYACRKTLADSRPRVRGRFSKNDDFGETLQPAGTQF